MGDVNAGAGMDLSGVYLTTEKGSDAYSTYPITVECRAKLRPTEKYAILVCNEPRESYTHWELYADKETGRLAAHFSWWEPFETKSDFVITDERWHDLAMQFDGQTLRLLVDGKPVAEQKLTRANINPPRSEGPLTVGAEQSGPAVYHCDGMIQWLRISKGIREIRAGAPAAAAPPSDDMTIGLWTFDRPTAGEETVADASALKNAMRVNVKPTGSLDELDRASYKAGPSPLDSSAAVTVTLSAGPAEHPAAPAGIDLSGEWEMAEDGAEAERLEADWRDGIRAIVPGSVHGALRKAGLIPDHTVGTQDNAARLKSFKTYWFRRRFNRPKELTGPAKLVFGGVAVKCEVWLNGKRLGEHEGMFGGPEYDVTSLLANENTIVVKVHPAPFEIGHGFPNNFFLGMNVGWMRTVVFNNVYGWHYSNIPSIGIWRPVKVEFAPAVKIVDPFVATRDARGGVIEIIAELQGQAKSWSGKLAGTIEPETFEGAAHQFSVAVNSDQQSKKVHLRLSVPNPKLWWPNDLGEPNLYRLKLSFVPDGGGASDTTATTFGIRTIEMAPLPCGPVPEKFNWTFVINGRPSFVKGNGWCTMDSFMDFSRARYDRMLTIADQQHVQMVRAWGSGMPETDEFFDLCDRKGIMVMQEWPTAWNSHQWQPFDQLEETVRLNTLRLRNHPSLVMWGGGNESDKPFGEAIDMMGRYAVELDGTRPFHRGEPWGGSRHDYTCWWGRAPLDHNLTMEADFFGEFGLASSPVYESVQRYLPEGEKALWPPPPHGSFAYHTPVFNKMQDLERLLQYAGDFVKLDDMRMVTVGSQLGQATGVRHTLERARTRWPKCTGALYYKMNDNWPAASWSCADWYGAPKIGHWFFQDAFAPLHACVLFESFETRGKELSLPVFLLDDAEALSGGAAWEVVVRAFDGKLNQIKRESFKGSGPVDRVRKLGSFALSAAQTDTAPLLIVVEVNKDGALADRTFYWSQFRQPQGCLFELPRTKLAMTIQGSRATVKNVGNVPAVGVHIERPGHADTFLPADNYFWLDPGESRTVEVNQTGGLSVESWNAGCGPG